MSHLELLEQVYTTKTSQESLDFSKVLAARISKDGISSPVIESIKKAARNKKSPNHREGSMLAASCILSVCGISMLPYFVPLLSIILDLHADQKVAISEAAEFALNDLFLLLPESSVAGVVLPLLFESVEGGKWQTKIIAMKCIVRLSLAFPAVLSQQLPGVIPIVTSCMHDSKPEVASAAVTAMLTIVRTVGNPDIEPFLPDLVDVMEHPSNVDACIETVSKTTFVAQVTSPALSVLVPLLVRALNIRSTATIRRTVIIITNLCKMVNDPNHAYQFLPQLLPGLDRLIDGAAFAEIRALSQVAKETLVKAGGDVDAAMKALAIAPSDPTQDVRAKLNKNLASEKASAKDAAIFDASLSFVASLLGEMIKERNFHRKEWNTIISITKVNEETKTRIANVIYTHFHTLDHKNHPEEASDDDEEEGEELCDCEFSLAYGGMLLLNHTRLRLKRGRKYGLCGRNGAGKSTLMRAISEGKLEGFPSPDVVKTCIVDHALQGTEITLSIVDFILADSKLKEKTRKEVEDALLSVGFISEQLGSSLCNLSGGQKMKVELARALIIKPDILLLDEPSNHLDVANIEWLVNWINGLRDVTCLIVSHESTFLDAVCTDILHYENKKLVLYKGNLSAFVKKHPEAKSYYTLSAANNAFAFPKPSILTGVRSNTKAILKMTNLSFTYPTASKKGLDNFTGNLSLSSRVGIIGKNGAGKSTLVKLMTGELHPDEGLVWKHPNLRIGYVAQHAFHHLEEHLDITPFKYLTWRYQGGQDREVLLKDTRKLTADDEKQLMTEMTVDGGKRRIEILFGRQKLKKSYQYEIKWLNMSHRNNTWVARDKLIEAGFSKLVQAFDDRESSREGLGFRDLTQAAITQHFADVGLDPKIAENNSMASLSGGQKVKVVIAACMWNNPHILVFDEPTNFLDRDALGGLAVAIRDWNGAVVLISHNEEFIKSLCPETWTVVDGIVTRNGITDIDLANFEDLNTDDLPVAMPKKKKLTRNEVKAQLLRRRERHLLWLLEGGEQVGNSDSD